MLSTTDAPARPDRAPLRYPDRRGAKNARAVLTEAEVVEIRARYAAGGVFYYTLAEEYGVAISTIRLVVVRGTWGHL